MKFIKTTLILFLVLIVLTGISAISAQDVNETLAVSEDTSDNVELSQTQESSEILANESEVTVNETAPQQDNNTLTINTGPTHSESNKIVLDTKISSNTIKGDEEIYYTITIRNNNLFDVYDINLKYGETDYFEMHFVTQYTGVDLDEQYIIISKLPALSAKTFKLAIQKFNPGETSLNIQLNPKVVPYEEKTRIKTVVKTPTSVKKTKKFKATITHKVNKKPVKNVKVKFKVYTGKKYKYIFRKTNSKGVITFSCKSLKKGKHKIIISSLNKNYSISKTIKVKIK